MDFLRLRSFVCACGAKVKFGVGEVHKLACSGCQTGYFVERKKVYRLEPALKVEDPKAEVEPAF